MAEQLELKIRRFLWLISVFVEVSWEKLVAMAFLSPLNSFGDSRKFSGSVKSRFSSKVRLNVHTTLNENDQLIRNECKRANNFDNFFTYVVPNLGIKVGQHCVCNTSNISNSIEKVIKKYKKRSVDSMSDKMISSVSNPAGIYLFKVNNRNTRTRCEICSKLTIKIPERRSSASIVNFEQVNAGSVGTRK